MSGLVKLEIEGRIIEHELANDGSPLYPATEIAEALGYSNARDAISKHVDEKDVAFRDALSSGGKQKKKFITGIGVQMLIYRSDLPKAREYTRRVAEHMEAVRLGKIKLAKGHRVADPARAELARMRETRLASTETRRASVTLMSHAKATGDKEAIKAAAFRAMEMIAPSPVAPCDTIVMMQNPAPTEAIVIPAIQPLERSRRQYRPLMPHQKKYREPEAWHTSLMIAGSTGLNASMVGKVSEALGLRRQIKEMIHLSAQKATDGERDVPCWEYRGKALAFLLDACRFWKRGEFSSLNEVKVWGELRRGHYGVPPDESPQLSLLA